MGLDYTYRLYFPRERIPEALQGLAAMCVPPPRTAHIRLPQGIREFPFAPFTGEPTPNWDDESYSFEVILRLSADDALEKFIARINPQQRKEQEEADFGYVSFRVANPPDEINSSFVFIAGGNRMSWAFLDSTSMRRAFVRLLETHGGLCGLLDMDEQRLVFWWRGQETWELLEDAWTLKAVDAQMRAAFRRRGRQDRPARRYRCRKK